MDISEKIINSVVREMIGSAQKMGRIVVIPNTYDVYIHTDDFKDVRHFLHFLRQEVIARLDAEVSKRSKPGLSGLAGLGAALNKLLGFEAFGGNKGFKRVKEHWDINFHECDGKISIGDQVFTLRKGEVCTVRNFSSYEHSDLGSEFRTVVTIYEQGDLVRESLIVPPQPAGGPVRPTPTPTAAYFATLEYKYKDSSDVRVFQMAKERIVIGRAPGEGEIDLLLDVASNRVSRRHVEIRYDEPTGKFFLRSFGAFGTTVNGVKAPVCSPERGEQPGGGEDIDLPDRARIALAGGEVIIDFSIG